MELLNLKPELAKLYSGYAFKGEVRKRIESHFEDNDWMFLAKTLRQAFSRGTVEIDRDLPILLLILASREDVNQKYVYGNVKNINKEVTIIPALWKSYLKADRQYLYRRAYESISLAIDLADGHSNLSDTGWQEQMENAAYVVLAYLIKERTEQYAAVSKPASRRSRKENTGGTDSPA